ncbi:purine permease 3-like [Triticum dicoccoides]|uniref:purine permease 3-like n=1 Tax=Triticum dicoccoides TaxID=85692 RepID=UPI000E78F3AF|nr:purine permease 3-like [Triticum dicoccoides]
MATITASASSAMQEAAKTPTASPPRATAASTASPARYRPSPLVIFSACLVLIGAGGPLLLRVYFVHGGQRLWLSALLQISGWPLLLPPLCVSLFRGRRHGIANLLLPPRLVVAAAVLGGFYAVSCYVYAMGSQALPLSTSSLLLATQLAFTAVFAFLFVGLRFTPFSANAVLLLIIGPAVLGVGPGAGKPAGVTSKAYWTGFCEGIAAAALAGLVLPLVEVAMERYGRRTGPAARTPPPYSTVMQMQAVMGAAGTIVCLLGMAIKSDFGALRSEAAAFGLGETNYYLVLVWDAVAWQLLNLGIMGLITCASSLLAGIMIAVLLPLSQILAVMFLHEKFDGPKGIALVLSLWGFASYMYGEKVQQKKLEAQKSELLQQQQQVGSKTGDLELAAP